MEILPSFNLVWATVVFVVALLILQKLFSGGNSRLPPSPTRLPLFGNVLLLLKYKDNRTLQSELAKQFGGILTFWVGSSPTIMVSSTEVARKLFVEMAPDTSNRDRTNLIFKLLGRNGRGVLTADYGKKLTHNRKILINSLRTLFNNKTPQGAEVIDSECSTLVGAMQIANNSADVRSSLFNASARLISGACFGASFVDNSRNVQCVIETMDLAFQAITVANISCLAIAPFLFHVPLFGFDAVKRFAKSRDALIESEIARHRQLLGNNDRREDSVIDDLISSEDDAIDEDEIVAIVTDLLAGGFETIGSTLHWAVYCLIEFPEWQQKLREDIDSKAAELDNLSQAEEKHFPLVRAFYHEVQRWGGAVAVSAPHVAANDLTVNDYIIPRGTQLVISIDRINNDDPNWKDPSEFNPVRFLDEDGSFRLPNNSFLSFGIGPRTCPGEAFAKREMFYMLLYMVSHLEFCDRSEQGVPKKVKRKFGLRSVPEFKIQAIPRSVAKGALQCGFPFVN